MKKIAFVDIGFHSKTKSSEFFVNLIKTRFSVDHIYLTEDYDLQISAINAKDYYAIVCWQTEFVAHYFLLKGKRVICIPMYDGVSNHPDWYWNSLNSCGFICFSKTLHTKFNKLGLESIYIQYYKDTKKFSKSIAWDMPRFFFWQRRPNEGLDYKFALNIIGLDNIINRKASLHVHNAPDSANFDEYIPPIRQISVSGYALDDKEYFMNLSNSNIFICPRKTEGIGMAMVEALCNGMVVIADNKPTANEYIIDGYNGILIDYDNPELINFDIDRFIKIGSNAKYESALGYEIWLKNSNRILNFIERIHPPLQEKFDEKIIEKHLDIIKCFESKNHKYLARLYNEIGMNPIFNNYDKLTFVQIIKLFFSRYLVIRFAHKILKKLKTKLKYKLKNI